MLSLIKIAFVFLLILFLLRKKINVGYALIVGAIALIFLFPIEFNRLPLTILKAFSSHSFLNLFSYID